MAKKKVKKKTKKIPPRKERIAKQLAEMDVESIRSDPNIGPVEQPRNPEFEKAAQVTEPPIENRGGVREGAGRPLGMTEEKARIKNLPKQPSNSIKHGAVSLFLFWSKAAKIEDLALTDEEVNLWSLPATQLQENYFPGLIPEIMSIWVEFIYATTRIMKSRFDLIDEVRRQRRKAKPKTAGPGDTIIHFTYGNGQALHAVPAGEACMFSDEVAKINCPVCRDMLDKSKQN